jgi:hypothetical protein
MRPRSGTFIRSAPSAALAGLQFAASRRLFNEGLPATRPGGRSAQPSTRARRLQWPIPLPESIG